MDKKTSNKPKTTTKKISGTTKKKTTSTANKKPNNNKPKTTNKKTNATKANNKSKTTNKKTNPKQENKPKIPWEDRWYNQKQTFTLDRKVSMTIGAFVLALLLILMSLSITISAFKHHQNNNNNPGGIIDPIVPIDPIDPSKPIGPVDPVDPIGPQLPPAKDEFNFAGINEYGMSSWTTHYFAPYVDMTTTSSEIAGIHGSAKLEYLSENQSAYYYNLGFIQSYSGTYNTGTEYGEILNWGWGGMSAINETSSNDWQFSGINQSIDEFRANVGGDITISFGGASGMSFWMNPAATVDTLVNTYEYLIDGYNLTIIDLDIEGGVSAGQNEEANIMNAKAIKQVQEDTDVRVNITLPSTDHGLDDRGINSLRPYIEEGVDIEMINIMSMYLGSDYSGDNGKDEGKATIDAIDGLANQVTTLYDETGKDLPVSDVYSMLGATNTIGNESGYNFTLEEATTVIDYARQKDLGTLSFWCANRDGQIGGYTTNNGVYDPWAFGNLYRWFPDHN